MSAPEYGVASHPLSAPFRPARSPPARACRRPPSPSASAPSLTRRTSARTRRPAASCQQWATAAPLPAFPSLRSNPPRPCLSRQVSSKSGSAIGSRWPWGLRPAQRSREKGGGRAYVRPGFHSRRAVGSRQNKPSCRKHAALANVVNDTQAVSTCGHTVSTYRASTCFERLKGSERNWR